MMKGVGKLLRTHGTLSEKILISKSKIDLRVAKSIFKGGTVMSSEM